MGVFYDGRPVLLIESFESCHDVREGSSKEKETQLVGRTMRLGQKRDVTIHTIQVENTAGE